MICAKRTAALQLCAIWRVVTLHTGCCTAAHTPLTQYMQGPDVVASVLASPKAPVAGPSTGEADADQSGVNTPPLLAHWPAPQAVAASDGIAAASGPAPGTQPTDAAGVVAVVNNPIFCSSPENDAAGEQRNGASSIRAPGSPCDTVSSFGNADAEDQSDANHSHSDGGSEIESQDSDGDSEDGDCRGGSWSDHRAAAMHSAASSLHTVDTSPSWGAAAVGDAGGCDGATSDDEEGSVGAATSHRHATKALHAVLGYWHPMLTVDKLEGRPSYLSCINEHPGVLLQAARGIAAGPAARVTAHSGLRPGRAAPQSYRRTGQRQQPPQDAANGRSGWCRGVEVHRPSHAAVR
jgi:hypothetical protein